MTDSGLSVCLCLSALSWDFAQCVPCLPPFSQTPCNRLGCMMSNISFCSRVRSLVCVKDASVASGHGTAGRVHAPGRRLRRYLLGAAPGFTQWPHANPNPSHCRHLLGAAPGFTHSAPAEARRWRQTSLSAPIRRLAQANNHGLHAAHRHGLYATVWLRALSLIRCSPPHP